MSNHHHHHQHEYQEHNILAFSNNEFNHSTTLLAQQTRLHKHNKLLREFQQAANSALTQDPSSVDLNPVYDSTEMLSEMFSNANGPGPSSEMLDYRRAVVGLGSDWYEPSSRQVVRDDNMGDQPQQQLGGSTTTHHHHQNQMDINVNTAAAAIPLFLTNPPTPRPDIRQGFQPPDPNYWTSDGSQINNLGQLPGSVEGQGLSLSLSSSLEATTRAEQLSVCGGDHHNSSNNHNMFLKLLQQPILHNLQGVGTAFEPGPVNIGFGSGAVNGLRNSKYVKAAQELLEEFCSVGRGQQHQVKKPKLNADSGDPNPSLTKDPPQLTAAERGEHQRRKVKLLSMLDEVDRRYNHYCEQMQMVVNSFDLVMGYGAATPYTTLAQKAMSRHFRCLKNAIQVQVRSSCEALGEKDPTINTGLTKGETPRLKMLEQSLRQQRAFHHHQMGMMDHEAWRPQRGLPERSVNILRSWLFEHFLHPYPSDADKHILARQTGLSRNQVSNWFINARVRLWKPMVEEMYQQEAADQGQDLLHHDHHQLDKELHQTKPNPNPNPNPNTNTDTKTNSFAKTQQRLHCSTSTSNAMMILTHGTPNSDTILNSHPNHHLQLPSSATTIGDDNVAPDTMIRFGVSHPGDVSLTLGLQHAGNTTTENTTIIAFSAASREF